MVRLKRVIGILNNYQDVGLRAKRTVFLFLWREDDTDLYVVVWFRGHVKEPGRSENAHKKQTEALGEGGRGEHRLILRCELNSSMDHQKPKIHFDTEEKLMEASISSDASWSCTSSGIIPREADVALGSRFLRRRGEIQVMDQARQPPQPLRRDTIDSVDLTINVRSVIANQR